MPMSSIAEEVAGAAQNTRSIAYNYMNEEYVYILRMEVNNISSNGRRDRVSANLRSALTGTK